LGGTGGSGIVVLSYPSQFNTLSSISPSLEYTTAIIGSNRVYVFTSGTGTVRW
jgi:tellurite resistance protein TehA-like permease